MTWYVDIQMASGTIYSHRFQSEERAKELIKAVRDAIGMPVRWLEVKETGVEHGLYAVDKIEACRIHEVPLP